MSISEETLRFRKALCSLKEQAKLSKKYVNKHVKEKDLYEAFRSDESRKSLEWAISHIEWHLRHTGETK